MKIAEKPKLVNSFFVISIYLFLSFFWIMSTAQFFEPGKTYNKSN